MGQLQSTRQDKHFENFDLYQNSFAKIDEDNLEVSQSTCLCAPKNNNKRVFTSYTLVSIY